MGTLVIVVCFAVGFFVMRALISDFREKNQRSHAKLDAKRAARAAAKEAELREISRKIESR